MLKYLFILLFFAQIFSQNSKTLQKRDYSFVETEVHESGRLIKHMVNKKYDFITLYKDGKSEDILLEETFYQTDIPGTEGRETKINIKAWGNKTNNKFDSKLWEINDIGYEVKLYWDYLKFIVYGCCGANDAHIYYLKDTGEKFLTASSRFAFLNVPNTKNKRITTFLSSNAMWQLEERGDYKFVLGVLYYGSERKIKEQILITGELNDLHSTPNMTFKDYKNESNNLTLWSANKNTDPEAITGVNIILDFDFFKIEVPIIKDHLEIERASLPEQYDIRLIPVGIGRTKYLSEGLYKAISVLSKSELRLLRNEIFARRGHSFKSEDLREYYKNKIWYQEIKDYKVSKDELSEEELSMIEAINKLESSSN